MDERLSMVDTVCLARSAAAGDTAAFELLMTTYRDRVFRLALRMLGNREEAEDIQQEAFIQAFRKLHTLRGHASFGTWIYAITARLCLSRKRNLARHPMETKDPLELAGDVVYDPQERLTTFKAAARVQQTLEKLSPSDRLLLLLKHVEELSHEEIAQVLGCSAESSRARLVRARRIFRERYGEKG